MTCGIFARQPSLACRLRAYGWVQRWSIAGQSDGVGAGGLAPRPPEKAGLMMLSELSTRHVGSIAKSGGRRGIRRASGPGPSGRCLLAVLTDRHGREGHCAVTRCVMTGTSWGRRLALLIAEAGAALELYGEWFRERLGSGVR